MASIIDESECATMTVYETYHFGELS
ncbi:hypothetical protein EYZ11_009874 [Aspergillus tanneri]|uniref:Uncharacterized protein n=1 Tax=Aspergillus tanneri TaxID=1220188 RepID=A0A4S3J718_9EURO|nr:hypothetical protein EYZ11_009874 [Aspergillus tanneri]